MKVLVLNGPNLGRLGRRQPEIYGTTTHAELAELCEGGAATLGLEVEVRQTNHEGELLDWLNAAADDGDPGGAQRRRLDPLLATPSTTPARSWRPRWSRCTSPTRIQRPEEFRHTSVVTPYAVEVIAGQGIDGYRMALERIAVADGG